MVRIQPESYTFISIFHQQQDKTEAAWDWGSTGKAACRAYSNQVTTTSKQNYSREGYTKATNSMHQSILRNKVEQPIDELFAFYWAQILITMFKRAANDRTLRQSYPIHIGKPRFFNIHSNIIFPYMSILVTILYAFIISPLPMQYAMPSHPS